MTFGDIQEYLSRRVLKNWQTDPELIPLAINLAQLEIQRSVVIDGKMVQRDWTCMENHYVRSYRLGGIPLEDAVTRVRAVYRAHQPAGAEARRGRVITPSSEDAQDHRRHDHHFDIHRDFDETGPVRRHGLHECWWIEERKLVLSRHSNCEDLNLWIDVFRTLPDLVNPTDSNWFTVHAWDALAWKAAAVGFVEELDVKRIAYFEGGANQRIKSAIEADERFSAAGVADTVVPARPNPFHHEYYGVG